MMNNLTIEQDNDFTFGKLLICWDGFDDVVGHNYGEIGIRTKDNKIYIDSEHMSRDFVKDVLNKLVDVAIFDWEVEP